MFAVRSFCTLPLVAAIALVLSGPALFAAEPRFTPFMQSVAEYASDDRDIAEYYQSNGYRPVWTGTDGAAKERRVALFSALARAGDHGLPVSSYQIDTLLGDLRQINTQRDLGRVEVELSRTFLKYARDVQTGVLVPNTIDAGIDRDVPLRDRTDLLKGLANSSPYGFLRSLPPHSPEYARLMRAKASLERQLDNGGWGPQVPARSLKPGQSGAAVVALRDRLIAMGYMGRDVSKGYGARLQKAVEAFQSDNGLRADGVAGAGTMVEINKQIEARLPNVLVAMERERWMNFPRGKRHVWVNLTDFSAAIVDDDKVTFRTRSVIGKNTADRQSPEFSDQMEYMELNPYWNVPRSISIKEYLPRMLLDPSAAAHLQLVDDRGNVVSRAGVSFSSYTPKSFPYNLRQPPSRGNALGLVKFMFPNPHNVYLHDTPAKSLFQRDRRDFSHGCIRLNDPFDFAYELLAPQVDDPVAFFQERLRTGQNMQIPLEEPVPVHLVYRTVFTSVKGRLNFRHDVYGRDAKIFAALRKAGVVMPAVRS